MITEAFGHMKSFFKMIGIYTVSLLILYVIIFIGALIFGASLGMGL